jgi:hypothetical protein
MRQAPIKKWREDCFYIFFECAINQTAGRALLKGDARFIEPQGSIGDAFPEETQKRTMAIRHRCFHPERIAKASL